jgi:hypothetical protein
MASALSVNDTPSPRKDETVMMHRKNVVPSPCYPFLSPSQPPLFATLTLTSDPATLGTKTFCPFPIGQSARPPVSAGEARSKKPVVRGVRAHRLCIQSIQAATRFYIPAFRKTRYLSQSSSPIKTFVGKFALEAHCSLRCDSPSHDIFRQRGTIIPCKQLCQVEITLP